MGMTIKETIPILHDMYNYYNDTDIDAYIGFDKEDNNAIEIALDTMRKYQKIKNIICKWKVGLYDDEGLCDTEVLELISDEVNGDRNDDR